MSLNNYISYTSQYTRNIDPETNKPYIVTGNATSTLSQENADVVAIGKVENNTNVIDYVLDIISSKYNKYFNNIIGNINNNKGDTGEQGPKGDTGDQGPIGIQGPKGDTGDQGPIGIQGSKGDTGDQGPIGIQGSKGDTGDQGPIGIQGSKGDTGDQGPIGIQGPKGENGTTEIYLFPNDFWNFNSSSMNNNVQTFRGNYWAVIQCSSYLDTYYQCFVPIPNNWLTRNIINIEINWIAVTSGNNWSLCYDIKPMIKNEMLPISNRNTTVLNVNDSYITYKSVISVNITDNLSNIIGYLVFIGRNGSTDTNTGNIYILSIFLS
jgi:hypothetical protein